MAVGVLALVCACGRGAMYGDPDAIPGSPDPSPGASPNASPGPAVQTFYWMDPVLLNPGSEDQFADLDVSGAVPAGATGVIVHVTNTGGGDQPFGLRTKGSSHNRTRAIEAQSHTWAMVGVDASQEFQVYEDELGDQDLWLIGYTTAGVEYIQDGIDITPGMRDAWVDIDISAYTFGEQAIGAIVEVDTAAGEFGVRMNGSNDGTVLRGRHMWVIIGVDDNQILEGYASSVFEKMYFVGYVTAGARFFTNAVDKSITPTGTWTSIELAADTVNGEIANGAFIAAALPNPNTTYGLRRHGSGENIILQQSQLGCGILETDPAQRLEGERSANSVGFFMVGYSTLEP